MITDEDFAKWESEQPTVAPEDEQRERLEEERLQASTAQYKADLASGRTNLLPEENIEMLDEDSTEIEIDMNAVQNAMNGQRGIGSPKKSGTFKG